MVKNTRRTQRGEASLSRERIVEAAIALLDEHGESGLTFRALSEELATGAGAIYWHVANKGELLSAACDAMVARAMDAAVTAAPPRETVRILGLGLFDAIDAHPWVGAELARSPMKMPMVRILEAIGRQMRTFGVAEQELWLAASSLLNFILGVAGQNAANSEYARAQGLVRASFFDAVSSAWSALDEDAFPFVRSMIVPMREHDDRADFLAGIDLILDGIAAR
ncbi:TetR/AcrR family transcriptional regulator [Massilia aerilata]|uniref:TetR/AcrR family transcriptional regulator n=1 Tax=Massilia aerilata TaxID=453817 RepID=A0ABW0RSF6_9BURK